MAVPSSGELSMAGLHKEKVNDDYNYSGPGTALSHVSLYDLVLGGNTNGSGVSYDVNSANSAQAPGPNVPYEMSDWYAYDHDAVGKSDIRLKTNIQLLGHSDLNIPIYSFKFKNDLNTTYKGVMAQDLLEMGFADSVVMGDDGFYSVKYDNIDVDFNVLTI